MDLVSHPACLPRSVGGSCTLSKWAFWASSSLAKMSEWKQEGEDLCECFNDFAENRRR